MSPLEIYRDRFAESGWEIFERAVEETVRRRQKYLGVAHILYALVQVNADYFLSLLRNLFDNPDAMERLTELIEERVRNSPRHEGQGIRLAPETISLFKRAFAKVRFDKRQRIEATDFFIMLCVEEKSLLRELLAKLLPDRRAEKKRALDHFALLERVLPASIPPGPQKYRYNAGETVRIKSGPFAAFIGTVEMVDKEVGVLNVKVSIFGREHTIGLGFIDVEKIKFNE